MKIFNIKKLCISFPRICGSKSTSYVIQAFQVVEATSDMASQPSPKPPTVKSVPNQIADRQNRKRAKKATPEHLLKGLIIDDEDNRKRDWTISIAAAGSMKLESLDSFNFLSVAWGAKCWKQKHQHATAY